MNILVTGGAGYLGAVAVPRLLGAGHHVTVLDNLTWGRHSLLHVCAHPSFDFVFGDARDERLLSQLVPGADVILPLAALVGAPACARDPWLASSLNVEAILTLLRIRSRSQLVLYPTTNSGYGTQTKEAMCTEDTPLEPISLYGETKATAERAVLDAGNSMTFRLATVFGVSPRMRTDLLVNYFVYAAITGGVLVIFEKDFKRNFVHIDDVADGFLHGIEHADDMIGRCYNLGLDSANLSKLELAMKIREHVPQLLIHCADIGRDPDRRNYVVSSRRLAEAGFTARRSLDQGIRELLPACRMIARTAAPSPDEGKGPGQ